MDRENLETTIDELLCRERRFSVSPNQCAYSRQVGGDEWLG